MVKIQDGQIKEDFFLLFDTKQFSREELLNKRAVFEEAYVIVDYHSLK